jgi:hypothetical protein
MVIRIGDESLIAAPVMPVQMEPFYEGDHHVQQTLIACGIGLRIVFFFSSCKEGCRRKLLVVPSQANPLALGTLRMLPC